MHVLGISYDPPMGIADLLARRGAGTCDLDKVEVRFGLGIRPISHLLLSVRCTVKVRSNEKGLEEGVQDDAVFSQQ